MLVSEKGKGRFSLKTLLILLLCVCLIVSAAFFAGATLGKRDNKPSITSDLLGQQLQDAQELVSVKYLYTNMGKFENQVDFYGWKVPFTTKSFLVSYDGVIKAGVDMSQVNLSVDEGEKAITITLPAGTILSHEIKLDSIQVFDETTNIFNPITIQNYTDFTADQKGAMEEHAIENGLLTAAEDQAGAAIRSLFSTLPGIDAYSVTIR